MQKYENTLDAFKNAPMADFVKKLKISGLIGYIGLIVYYPLLFTVLTPGDNSLAYISLTLFWVPLLFAVKGLIQGNPYTYAWSNFILMWCYMHGLTALWTFTGNKWFIGVELTLLTLGFIGNTYFARYRGRELGLALPKIKELKKQEKEMFEKNKAD